MGIVMFPLIFLTVLVSVVVLVFVVLFVLLFLCVITEQWRTASSVSFRISRAFKSCLLVLYTTHISTCQSVAAVVCTYVHHAVCFTNSSNECKAVERKNMV